MAELDKRDVLTVSYLKVSLGQNFDLVALCSHLALLIVGLPLAEISCNLSWRINVSHFGNQSLCLCVNSLTSCRISYTTSFHVLSTKDALRATKKEIMFPSYRALPGSQQQQASEYPGSDHTYYMERGQSFEVFMCTTEVQDLSETGIVDREDFKNFWRRKNKENPGGDSFMRTFLGNARGLVAKEALDQVASSYSLGFRPTWNKDPKAPPVDEQIAAIMKSVDGIRYKLNCQVLCAPVVTDDGKSHGHA